jgi:hypothetical protein
MFLNANLYTWSYRVADWAWEAELAQEVADAIMDTSGGEASISETAAEIGGLAAGSVLEALMLAPLELELELDPQQATSNQDDAGDPQAAPAAAATAAIDAQPQAQPEGLAQPEGQPQPQPQAPAQRQPLPQAKKAAAPAPAAPLKTPVVPVIAPLVDVSPLHAAAAPADAQRGHWVLKGYRTEIAFSVHPDSNKMDLAFQANEQSGADIDNKARARRPLAAGHGSDSSRAEGSRAWQDRGPEPE